MYGIYKTDTGRIDRMVQCELESDALIQKLAGEEIILLEDGQNDANSYVDLLEEIVVPLEATSLPPSHTLVSGTEWEIEVPEGTHVFYDGVLQGTIGPEASLIMEFMIVKTWEVMICPPFPYKLGTCIVEVTA